MSVHEITAGNYMQAILHAAMLLGNPRSPAAIGEITIFAHHASGPKPRCRIIVAPPADTPPPPVNDYRILFPARR